MNENFREAESNSEKLITSGVQGTIKQNGNYDKSGAKMSQVASALSNGNKPKTVQAEFEGIAQEVVNMEKSIPQQVEMQKLNRAKYTLGPDQVIPSNDSSTIYPEGAVKLAITKTGIGAENPISVPGLLHKAAKKFPEKTALAFKEETGTWKKITFREYEIAVRTCAKAFLKLGLRRYHSVCILGFNSPQWFIADLAAISAGGFAAGIYTTNSPEACFHCAQSSRANIIVVEDDKQLRKILHIKDRLSELKAIVQYEGKPNVQGVYSWDELLEIGKKESDVQLEEVLKTVGINECCTLVYTSGTAGPPKAVMLSHDNLTWTSHATASHLGLKYGSEVLVSYLPLSHIAAQIIDIFITMTVAATVYFADKDALKGTLVQTLQEVRPTQFMGVPRVWEKINEKMALIGSQAGSVRKALASWAKSQGLQQNMNRMNGNNQQSVSYMIANYLIFGRVKRALGLDRSEGFFSAGAPLSVEVKKYFMSLDIPVMEAFGMSESTGPHTLSVKNSFKLDSTGKCIPGMKIEIKHPDTNGEGEICLAGRNIFMGYLNDEVKTKETLDHEELLHSGDIGRIDEDGFVYITGRIKELIITAGGENIPPVLIEDTLKMELPCLSNAVLIGDKRKFLSVLLTLKTEMNPETGEPLNELSSVTKTWCRSVGSSAEKMTDISGGSDDKVIAAIQEALNRANSKAISNAQKVQKFSILPSDFSIATGELGPTMKVKRNVVAQKYADVIEKFYTENT